MTGFNIYVIGFKLYAIGFVDVSLHYMFQFIIYVYILTANMIIIKV